MSKTKKHIDRESILEAIKFLDKSPAVLWTGKFGAKERLVEWLDEVAPKRDE